MINKHILAIATCLATLVTPVLAADFKVEEATTPKSSWRSAITA
jgi:hypothetical protein